MALVPGRCRARPSSLVLAARAARVARVARVALAVLALVLLTTMPHLAPVSALSEVASTLRLEGTAVTPSTTAVAAPILSSGRYLVPVPRPEADTFLQVKRTIPRSTIWVGATLDMGPGSEAKDFGGSLFLHGLPDGSSDQECWSGSPIVDTSSTATGGESTPHFETWLQQTNRGGTACRTASSIVLQLSDYEWTPPAGAQVQIVVWEQPPVDDVSGLQAPSQSVTWNAFARTATTPITPGTTWQDAPDISNASVSFHLDPDSVAVFRMPLGYGQHGQALVTNPNATSSSASPDAAVWWASPMGGSIVAPTAQGAPVGGGSLVDDLGPAAVARATPTVNYRNRELVAGDDPDSPSVPGDYFLVVYLGRTGIPAGGLDLTLQSGFYTDYSAIAPPYTHPAAPVSQVASFETASPSASPSGGDGSATEQGTSGGVPWPVVLILFGGAAVFGALGVVVMGRGRRRT